MDVDGLEKAGSSKKNVSFASDTKPGSSSKEASIKKEDSKAGILAAKKAAALPEGQIGTLLVMKSGKVKMRLGKDILLDVSLPLPLSLRHLQRGLTSFATSWFRSPPARNSTSSSTSSILTPREPRGRRLSRRRPEGSSSRRTSTNFWISCSPKTTCPQRRSPR